jgi:hypothetical protein
MRDRQKRLAEDGSDGALSQCSEFGICESSVEIGFKGASVDDGAYQDGLYVGRAPRFNPRRACSEARCLYCSFVSRGG